MLGRSRSNAKRVYSLSSSANFSILSVILSKSAAGASSGIQGLHSTRIVIFSPSICSRQKYREGIGEYTTSFPHVGQRITRNSSLGTVARADQKITLSARRKIASHESLANSINRTF